MTESEFKQWFMGFKEGLGDALPTEKQWAKIQERVAEISGQPILVHHYYDYYRPYLWPNGWNPAVGVGGTTCAADSNNTMAFNQSGLGQLLLETEPPQAPADAVSYVAELPKADILAALGRADFAAAT